MEVGEAIIYKNIEALKHGAERLLEEGYTIAVNTEKLRIKIVGKEGRNNMNENYQNEETTQLREQYRKVLRDLKDCRNELCERCGRFTARHLGACEDCRWEKLPE